MKPVRLSAHAAGYIAKRGFTWEEVETAIGRGTWNPASHGRQECHHDFPFHQEWNGTFYVTKRVRPIFVEEAEEIVVVTVYTYYF